MNIYIYIMRGYIRDDRLLTDTSTEVTQQSKARHKDDFPLAFAPVMAEAIATAYKGATPDVQNKLRRVVEVWRDRAVFEGTVQSGIESRIDGKSSQDFSADTDTDGVHRS